MGLSAGSRIGPYEIVNLLGAGGMGEVYRARDPRLKRDVALKILPDSFSTDAERLARFQREAEVLASLNHPNIAAIYGLEEDLGSASAEATADKEAGHYVRALVLELVEGETLAERIARGPIPTSEALPLARQIAEALEAAHEYGVVHRDLKPANIKVREDGTVKVLDFGLAKLAAPTATAGQVSPSIAPTVTTPALMTGVGVLLGTAAYMSPEQAKGKDADKRSDIWSFGCVLFEMLSGKRPFAGDDVSDVLAGVLKIEPDWSALPAGLGSNLREIVRGCLQKDRRARIPDMSAIRFMLTVFTEAPASTQPAMSTKGTRRAAVVWRIAAILLAGVAVASLTTLYRERAVPSAATSFYISPPDGWSLATETSRTPAAISPDGRAIAFTARDAAGTARLWVRPIDSLTARLLEGTEDATSLFWSPDSRYIGFTAKGLLRKIEATGGIPQTICELTSGGSQGATWGARGEIVFNSGPRQLFRVSAAGGQPTLLVRAEPDLADYTFPWFMPNGSDVLFFASAASEDRAGIYVTSIDGGTARRVVYADSGAAYAPLSRRLFYVREGALFAQPFDIDTLSLSGDAQVVTESVATSATGLRSFSVSDTDALTYVAGRDITGDLALTWLDRQGKILDRVGPLGAYRGIDLSPDGQRVAAHVHDRDGGDIWITDLAAKTTSRFTFDAGQDNSSPIWSPDGKRIVFASYRRSVWGIYAKPADGSDGEERLVESDSPIAPVSWSRDERIVYAVSSRSTAYDFWMLPVSGVRTPVPLLDGPDNAMMGQVSPNGKWLAYRSDEDGRNRVYVVSFPSGGVKRQVSTVQGSFPRWRADGLELFFSTNASGGSIMAVPVMGDSTGFDPGSPVPLFNPNYINFQHPPGYHPFVVSPDGQRFLIPLARTETKDAPSRIAVVQNWASMRAR